MAISSKKKQSSALAQPPAVWVAIVALVVLLAIVVGIAHHALAPSQPNLAQALGLNKHPFPAWIDSDANRCGGDISKLSPQEQQRINAQYPGSGAIVMHAAYAVQHQ